jgi:hypothetical protein
MNLVTNKVSRTFDNLTLTDNNSETSMDIDTPDLPPNSDKSIQDVVQKLSDLDLQTVNDWNNYSFQIYSICTDLKTKGYTELPYPNLPKQKLKDIMYGKPVKNLKLTSEQLHDYLSSKLVSNAPNTMPNLDNLNEETSLDDMISLLAEGYSFLEGLNKKVISHYMDYGEWLNVAYAKFDVKKKRGIMKVTWATWLQTFVGISDSYARQLREIATLFGKYKKIRNLGIPFSELLKKKTDIFNMLEENKACGDFWLSS